MTSIDNKQDQLLANTATAQYRLVSNDKDHPIFAHILSMPDPNELTTERGAKFHYNDLERAHAKEDTLNPIAIGKDIANELKVVLHPLTQVLHEIS